MTDVITFGEGFYPAEADKSLRGAMHIFFNRPDVVQKLAAVAGHVCMGGEINGKAGYTGAVGSLGAYGVPPAWDYNPSNLGAAVFAAANIAANDPTMSLSTRAGLNKVAQDLLEIVYAGGGNGPLKTILLSRAANNGFKQTAIEVR